MASQKYLSTKDIPSTFKFAQSYEQPINEALKELVMEYRSQAKPLDVYTQLEEAAGLPGMKTTAATLREQIGNIEDTIKRVEPDVTATTGQSLVTEAQRRGIVTARQRPLLQNLAELTTGLGRVSESITASSADLANKVSLFLRGQEMDLEPIKLKYTALVDQAARLTSAFSVDAQNQLSVIMANWQRKNQLSDLETSRAFDLLKSEKDYKKELQKAAANAGARVSGSESINQLLRSISDVTAEQLQYEKSKRAGGGVVDTTSYYGGGGGSYYKTEDKWWEKYLG